MENQPEQTQPAENSESTQASEPGIPVSSPAFLSQIRPDFWEDF